MSMEPDPKSQTTSNHDVLIRLETIVIELRGDIKSLCGDVKAINEKVQRHEVLISRHDIIWKAALAVGVVGGGGTGVWQVLRLLAQ